MTPRVVTGLAYLPELIGRFFVQGDPSRSSTGMVMLLDPSIRETTCKPNYNLGDLVISEAIRHELGQLFDRYPYDRLSTHFPPTLAQIARANRARYRIACGTNLLSSHHKEYTPWKIGRLGAWALKPVILCGVGWWSDQDPPDRDTASRYRRILSKTGFHSVRDGMTEKRLRSVGITNVINTSCPSLWQLDGLTHEQLPSPSHRTVLTALSFWRKDPELDRQFIALLRRNYENVFVFPQGRKDAEYVAELGTGARILSYQYEEFDRFFEAHPDAEYVGLRLHAGIRSLRNGFRSLIIEVDNRAREISRDTGLPTSKRGDFEGIARWIKHNSSFSIKLNRDGIEKFKNQFLIPRIPEFAHGHDRRLVRT